jgi:hypothetical protein
MKAITLGTAAALAVVVAQGAQASNWSMTFTGYGLNQTVGVRFNNSESFDSANANSGFAGLKAGQHNFTVFGKTYSNYCVQIFEPIGAVGSTDVWCTADLASVPDAPPGPGPMGAIKAALMQDLYARFHETVKNSGDATQHAAFQVLVWEISHEKITAADAASAIAQLSLIAGALQINEESLVGANVFAAANLMLAQLGVGGFRSLGDNLFGLTNEVKQDQLVVVPIPAPALLAGLGLLGVGILRRRMK